MPQSLTAFCKKLATEKSVVVCCHISPDPDAIGSAAALQLILKASGANACFYLPEVLPGVLSPYLENVSIISEISDIPADAVPVVVDTATKERTFADDSFFERFDAGQVYVIDHHASNVGWGTQNFIDATAAASAVIVYEIAKCLNVELCVDSASLLYAGLNDDTGSFRYSNADERSFLVAGSLVGAGAKPEEIANALYFSIPERVMKLRSLALTTLQTHADGLVASIAITQKMLKDCGTAVEDSDGIVDIARSLEGVSCAIFFRQRQEGGWRVSLRSKVPTIDVNKVAANFGGGGHNAAAGCTLSSSGTYEESLKLVLDVLQEQL